MTTHQIEIEGLAKICESEQQSWSCKNMVYVDKCDWDYEHYFCVVCGRKMKLDLEEMR